MSLFALPHVVYRKIATTIDGMRKQAPAARMVGEFAVKHLANEANKKIADVTKSQQPNDPTSST
ncbi:MAG: hypothetical protein RLZ18_160 [Actinomycetota bacterium]|jgi:hypothetical protein